MAKKILLVVAVVVLGLVGVIASRPAEFRIERSVVISAPADVVQAQVVDFHKWGAWSPWEKLDPAQTRTYSGAESGVGAQYAWAGKKVGEGKMTIKEVTPGQRVVIDLEFITPMEARNVVELALTEQGTGTQVRWVMTGQNNFLGKAFSLVMDMDQMVGKDFESGLAALKTVSEGEAARLAEAKAAEAAAAAAPPAGEAVAQETP
ncbi:MAG: SRPBCC family protein [Myxococcota bacterium]|nr:SRPBCC family protein [Myxococcota bacterium]